VAGTVTRDGEGWVAYLRLEVPPGLSPITTVGRFATVEKQKSRGVGRPRPIMRQRRTETD
jgi:hypothetical protein